MIRVHGQDVTPGQSVSYLVAHLAPGTRVPIELIRGGKRQTVNATMATRPSEEELAGFSADGTPSAPDEGDETTSESAPAAIGHTTTPVPPPIARPMGADTAPRRTSSEDTSCGPRGRKKRRN